jgi:hypothetical protein
VIVAKTTKTKTVKVKAEKTEPKQRREFNAKDRVWSHVGLRSGASANCAQEVRRWGGKVEPCGRPLDRHDFTACANCIRRGKAEPNKLTRDAVSKGEKWCASCKKSARESKSKTRKAPDNGASGAAEEALEGATA